MSDKQTEVPSIFEAKIPGLAVVSKVQDAVPQTSLAKLPGLFDGVSKGIQGGESSLKEMAQAYEPRPK